MPAREADENTFAGWSESETMSLAGYNEIQLECCYWYGQKQFESELARYVFQASQDAESTAALDTELQNLCANFPYQSQLELLRNRLSFAVNSNIEMRSANTRHAYMTVVGALNMKGRTEDKKFFAEALYRAVRPILLNGTSRDMLEMEADDDDLHERPDINAGSDSPHSPTSFNESALSIGAIDNGKLRRAMNALYQFGCQRGITPDYSEIPSNKPLIQSVRLTYGNRSFEATAQNKKLAKQRAAINACEALGIEI